MGRATRAQTRSDDNSTADAGGWEYLDRWMTEKGLSNADLGRATGLGDSAISKWRRGIATPDVPSCRKIAAALGRPVLEVVVAAGHLSPEEARMKDKPKAPPPADRDPDEALFDDLLTAYRRAPLKRQRDEIKSLVHTLVAGIKARVAEEAPGEGNASSIG